LRFHSTGNRKSSITSKHKLVLRAGCKTAQQQFVSVHQIQFKKIDQVIKVINGSSGKQLQETPPRESINQHPNSKLHIPTAAVGDNPPNPWQHRIQQQEVRNPSSSSPTGAEKVKG
jgi:hypothetical protein